MYSLISKILRFAAPLLSTFSLIFVLLPTSVAAKDLISARSYLEDAQGQSTFDDAQAQSYATYEGILAKGYSDSTFWFRHTLVKSSCYVFVLRFLTTLCCLILQIQHEQALSVPAT
jgi:hypothetical protein